jgi:hypothetical protein
MCRSEIIPSYVRHDGKCSFTKPELINRNA